jgi:hypothetical protein
VNVTDGGVALFNFKWLSFSAQNFCRASSEPSNIKNLSPAASPFPLVVPSCHHAPIVDAMAEVPQPLGFSCNLYSLANVMPALKSPPKIRLALGSKAFNALRLMSSMAKSPYLPTTLPICVRALGCLLFFFSFNFKILLFIHGKFG